MYIKFFKENFNLKNDLKKHMIFFFIVLKRSIFNIILITLIKNIEYLHVRFFYPKILFQFYLIDYFFYIFKSFIFFKFVSAFIII